MEIDVEISVSNLRPIQIPTTVTGQPVIQGNAWLAGWSLLETTGAAGASCELKSNGNTVAVIGIGSGLSSNIYYGDKGIYCRGDITLVVLSGSVRGAVYATYLKPGQDYRA